MQSTWHREDWEYWGSANYSFLYLYSYIGGEEEDCGCVGNDRISKDNKLLLALAFNVEVSTDSKIWTSNGSFEKLFLKSLTTNYPKHSIELTTLKWRSIDRTHHCLLDLVVNGHSTCSRCARKRKDENIVSLLQYGYKVYAFMVSNRPEVKHQKCVDVNTSLFKDLYNWRCSATDMQCFVVFNCLNCLNH